MLLSFRLMDRHRLRPPQITDSAERRRTGNALVVDVGILHKDFPQTGVHLSLLWDEKLLGHCVHCNRPDS